MATAWRSVIVVLLAGGYVAWVLSGSTTTDLGEYPEEFAAAPYQWGTGKPPKPEQVWSVVSTLYSGIDRSTLYEFEQRGDGKQLHYLVIWPASGDPLLFEITGLTVERANKPVPASFRFRPPPRHLVTIH